jgi:hypothetical protein
MAINFWTLGGKPASYNPLPTGWNNFITIEITSYVVKFKAKSTSGASLRVKTDTTATGMNQLLVLTNTLSSFEFSFDNKAPQKFHFYDETSRGDIIITDIQLVEKPLPKLTVNGISSEVGDWEQGSITAEGGTAPSSTRIRLISETVFSNGQTYTLSVPIGYEIIVYKGTSLTSWGRIVVFTADRERGRIAVKKTNDSIITPAEIMNIKPMLNLGSTPAPYSKKTGDRMVMAVKPRVKMVGGKNVHKSFYEGYSFVGGIASDYVVVSPYEVKVKSGRFLVVTQEVIPNQNYTLSSENTAIQMAVYDEQSQTVISAYTTSGRTFNVGSRNKVKIYYYTNAGDGIIKNPMLTLGNGVYPFEPYTEIIPPAKKGLVMDGVTNYLQLPSMTMDSVEIDCLIDGVPPKVDYYLIDARNGLSNGYFNHNDNVGSGWNSLTVDGVVKPSKRWTDIPKGQRTKIKLQSISSFNDDVMIFARFQMLTGNLFQLKGTIYKVICFLNGQVVAEYDFTNPNNIVGDKVLQKAKNLIPSFDSGQWSLHPNFKVLGKDVGRLDSTGLAQDSFCSFPVISGKTYYYNVSANGLVRIQKTSLHFFNGANQIASGNIGTFTADDSFNGFATIRMTCSVVGSFDFISPQLYELTGKEGTIYGNPVSELKAPKRVLFAKR